MTGFRSGARWNNMLENAGMKIVKMKKILSKKLLTINY